jgi:leucyl-tRNA synthetase
MTYWMPAGIYSSIREFRIDEVTQGAVFGSPTHDQRELDFQHIYHLVITRIFADGDLTDCAFDEDVDFTGPDTIVNSHSMNGMAIDQAKVNVIARAGRGQKHGADAALPRRLGRFTAAGGAPIPIIHCQTCGAVHLPDDELPVKLTASFYAQPQW